MKKIVLSLAGVLAATAFAPEASAVPAFARQTGMACSACHYQHFPLLNGFGRSFKGSGYTLMGAQTKVEGENLDIPDRVNMAVYNTAFVSQESGTDNRSTIGTPGTGGEFSLFMGGRGSEFLGFIAEAGLGGGGAGAPTNQGGAIAATKMLMLFPVGDSRMGLSVHSSQGQGVAYSFETMNTGAVGTHKLMGNAGPSNQHLNATSAAMYLGTQTAATGASFVANNSMGFVNVGVWEKAGNDAVTGANSLTLNYARAVYTADIAGFDMGFGIQHFGGTTTVLNNTADANIIDFQAQGDAAGMPLGVYASYGTAAASATSGVAATNMFNADTVNAKTSLNVAASLEFMKATTLQAGVRMGKQWGETDNAIMVGATYDLAQNIALGLNYTMQSGSYWDKAAAGTLPAGANVTNDNGKNATTLLLEALF
jgi:hypothetical protein